MPITQQEQDFIDNVRHNRVAEVEAQLETLEASARQALINALYSRDHIQLAIFRENQSYTPLMIAARLYDIRMVECLLHHGADPNIKADDSTIALDQICDPDCEKASSNSKTKTKMIQKLISSGSHSDNAIEQCLMRMKRFFETNKLTFNAQKHILETLAKQKMYMDFIAHLQGHDSEAIHRFLSDTVIEILNPKNQDDTWISLDATCLVALVHQQDYTLLNEVAANQPETKAILQGLGFVFPLGKRRPPPLLLSNPLKRTHNPEQNEVSSHAASDSVQKKKKRRL